MSLRRDLETIVRAGIDGVEPAALLRRALAGDDAIRGRHRIAVIAAGKAAVRMAVGAAELGLHVVTGLVIGPAAAQLRSPWEVAVGGHPLPTPQSEAAGRRALALADSLNGGELLLCLLSGGASALMAVPAPGITLDDKHVTTSLLLRAGADIAALNAVRKHLSAIKGGGLARHARSGCHTLAISDVVGDDMGVIASGPGVTDPTTFADALETLDRFGGRGAFPVAVVDRLVRGVRGEVQETMKASDPDAIRATARVIGSRRHAMDAAAAAARDLGYQVVQIDAAVVGEAREAGVRLMRDIAARTAGVAGRVCVVSSGETTVRVTGPGRGGRNQELALAAARELSVFVADACLASVGTDGIDGPTDAAGAIVDRTTIQRATDAGLDPDALLRDNDSYRFFKTIGDLVVTGPTGTNVGDLQVVLTAVP